MSLHENMSEEQILDSLFEAAEKLPEETVRIKRLDMQMVLQGLTSNKVDSIRERCTVRRTVKGLWMRRWIRKPSTHCSFLKRPAVCR